MLEDLDMDKKNRLLQTPKGAVESKKAQDGTGKSFPKVARKRETTGSKTEQNRNVCVSQKKYHDKRPAPRRSGNSSGAAISQLEELDEFGLLGTKTKKKNINYLLNFKCKPRELEEYESPRYSRSTVPHSIRDLMATQKHKYNKEQFLQANCQFVVRASHDYSVYMADPDILVDWNLVEQIRVSSMETVNCPICLYPPSAGKITRCGHIYCWSCILHYLSLTDKPWHKCPICFEAIHQKDLKSVSVLEKKPYSVGEPITFQLMKREKGSTIAVPVSEANTRNNNKLLSANEPVYATVYSKLLLANFETVLNIIEIEESALRQQQVENEGCPELCFIDKALQQLSERKSALYKEINDTIPPPRDPTPPFMDLVSDKESKDERDYLSIKPVHNSITYVSAFDDIVYEDTSVEKDKTEEEELEEGSDTSSNSRNRHESVSSTSEEEPCTNVAAEDLEIPTSHTGQHKDFYFYQAIDGQYIFIHALNVRMLTMTYGSLDRCPLTLTGTVVEKESGSMTDELRKRLRYLQHLPVTCQFEVAEIELQPPVITPEAQVYFKDHVEFRARQRMKKEKEEKKFEKKVKQLERSHYKQQSPPRRLRLDSLHHFPECGSDTPVDVSPRSNSPASSSRASSPLNTLSHRSLSPVTSAVNSLSLDNQNTFAETGVGGSGAWQKRAPPPSSDHEIGQSSSHRCNLSDAVEAALLRAQREKEGGNEATSSGKKKKKQKHVPLYSMGMVYSKQ